MTTHSSNTVYQQVVTISHTYLGPASERFIDRQIKNHLDKNPGDIEAGDIHKLIDWIRIAVSFLTEDSDLIEEYVHQLKQIANKPKKDS
jgi:hypothetical protein